MDRVVKCNVEQCGKHFMYTKEDTKCPFCLTEYGLAVEKKPEEKPKEKRTTIKLEKESFKIWKDN